MYFSLDVLEMINGGRRDFWLTQVKFVEQFVNQNQDLERVVMARTQGVRGLEGEGGESKATARAGGLIFWDPTRGGLISPHLHYRGEIFLLNEKQWTDFSRGALKTVAERLANAQSISFNGLMAAADAAARV